MVPEQAAAKVEEMVEKEAEVARYADPFDAGGRVRAARRGFHILGNRVHAAHEVGIDIRGDQLDVEIRDNVVENVGYRVRIHTLSRDAAAGIKLGPEPATTEFLRFLKLSPTHLIPLPRVFHYYPRNVLIADNEVRDSWRGISVVGPAEQHVAFPGTLQHGEVTVCGQAPARCASQVSVLRNQTQRTTSWGILINSSRFVVVEGNEIEDAFLFPPPDKNCSATFQVHSRGIMWDRNIVAMSSPSDLHSRLDKKKTYTYYALDDRSDTGQAPTSKEAWGMAMTDLSDPTLKFSALRWQLAAESETGPVGFTPFQ